MNKSSMSIPHIRLIGGACAALMAGLVVSCKRDPDPQAGTSEEIRPNATLADADKPQAIPVAPTAPEMSSAEFGRRFIEILSDRQIQSALAGRVDQLCEHLDSRHLDDLFELAASGPPEEITDAAWLLGFNQMMANARKRFAPEAAAVPLFHLASNSAASNVMRDYASQHYMLAESAALETAYGSEAPENGRAHLEQVLNHVDTLVSGGGDTGTLPGTTLMGLAALSERMEKHPEGVAKIRERASALVMPIFKDYGSNSAATRISAIQTAGRLGIGEAGPLIAGVAMDKSASIKDRLSAIASLRRFPDLVDPSILQESLGGNKKLILATRSLISDLNLEAQQ